MQADYADYAGYAECAAIPHSCFRASRNTEMRPPCALYEIARDHGHSVILAATAA